MAALYVVATPIGNLEDVTHRALRVLGDVATVYAEDTRRTRVLLERYAIQTPLRSLTEHNEEGRIREILDRLATDQSVALVSDAGTPLVSDPGQRLVRRVTEHGHGVIPVPGPSAVLAALVASGLPAVPFTFEGFLPRKGSGRGAALARVAASPGSVVLFESPGRLDRLLQDLRETCGADREVAVGRELTKMHEEFFRGTLAEACSYYQDRTVRGEVTLVVAPGTPGVPAPDDDVVQGAARSLLAEGLSPKDVVSAVAQRFDIGRNRAYRLVHSLDDA